MKAVWLPALRDGLVLGGQDPIEDEALTCAFYGDLFRPAGKKAAGDIPYEPVDVEDEEADLLGLWWQAAADIEGPSVPEPPKGEDHRIGDGLTRKGGTPGFVQTGLRALSGSRFFANLTERAMIGALKQVLSYMRDEGTRAQILQRVEEAIDQDTKLIVGHSLGSVIAYEALCAHPEWHVTTLVTLGSPLGISNLIFDRLHPPPQGGRGAWPEELRQWINIADEGDVVALVKHLRERFGDQVMDISINNGAQAHDISPYFSARETGKAIGEGLAT